MKIRSYLPGFLLLLTTAIHAQQDVLNAPEDRITDARDGTGYRTVTIGNQVWMAENLRYLPSVVGPEEGSVKEPLYYVYGYNGTDVLEATTTANYEIYGVLYNWSAAMNGARSSTSKPSGVQGVCPAGWHLPSDAEWTQLTDYLSINVAGGSLKSSGTAHWDSPNTGGNNVTGFSALPGGYRSSDGYFVSMGEDSDFWSASKNKRHYAWFRNIHYNEADVGRNSFPKDTGFSVRCVKD
jgi:uncharacterized protein (TIGR02145 family)